MIRNQPLLLDPTRIVSAVNIGRTGTARLITFPRTEDDHVAANIDGDSELIASKCIRGAVPAAFNNIVGLEPSRGMLSIEGVVPACRSLDCVSVLALTATDALAVLKVASAYDSSDPFSRPEAQQYPLRAQTVRAGFRFGFPRWCC